MAYVRTDFATPCQHTGTKPGCQRPPAAKIAVFWRADRQSRIPIAASDISFLELGPVMILLLTRHPSAHREGNIMRWKEGRRSENVEDRRGITPAGIAIGGGIGTLILALAAIFLGADPRQVLNALQQQNQQAARRTARLHPEALKRKNVSTSSRSCWRIPRTSGPTFPKDGQGVPEAQARDASTARSSRLAEWASAAVGPFYCPADSNVYIDVSFFKELEEKFKAPGDFAQAYVVAHEIGHHVQNLLGISNKVHAEQSRMSKEEANELSVRLELQADFLAGVWAHHAQKTAADPRARRCRERLERGVGDR